MVEVNLNHLKQWAQKCVSYTYSDCDMEQYIAAYEWYLTDYFSIASTWEGHYVKFFIEC